MHGPLLYCTIAIAGRGGGAKGGEGKGVVVWAQATLCHPQPPTALPHPNPPLPEGTARLIVIPLWHHLIVIHSSGSRLPTPHLSDDSCLVVVLLAGRHP